MLGHHNELTLIQLIQNGTLELDDILRHEDTSSILENAYAAPIKASLLEFIEPRVPKLISLLLKEIKDVDETEEEGRVRKNARDMLAVFVIEEGERGIGLVIPAVFAILASSKSIHAASADSIKHVVTSALESDYNATMSAIGVSLNHEFVIGVLDHIVRFGSIADMMLLLFSRSVSTADFSVTADPRGEDGSADPSLVPWLDLRFPLLLANRITSAVQDPDSESYFAFLTDLIERGACLPLLDELLEDECMEALVDGTVAACEDALDNRAPHAWRAVMLLNTILDLNRRALSDMTAEGDDDDSRSQQPVNSASMMLDVSDDGVSNQQNSQSKAITEQYDRPLEPSFAKLLCERLPRLVAVLKTATAGSPIGRTRMWIVRLACNLAAFNRAEVDSAVKESGLLVAFLDLMESHASTTILVGPAMQCIKELLQRGPVEENPIGAYIFEECELVERVERWVKGGDSSLRSHLISTRAQLGLDCRPREDDLDRLKSWTEMTIALLKEYMDRTNEIKGDAYMEAGSATSVPKPEHRPVANPMNATLIDSSAILAPHSPVENPSGGFGVSSSSSAGSQSEERSLRYASAFDDDDDTTEDLPEGIVQSSWDAFGGVDEDDDAVVVSEDSNGQLESPSYANTDTSATTRPTTEAEQPGEDEDMGEWEERVIQDTSNGEQQ